MANNRITVAVIMLLCCSVVLTGCKDDEKEKALEEVSNLKAQLTKVEGELAQITTERDALKTAADEVITLREKVDKVTKERNLAVDKARIAQAEVERLKGQLAEQRQKVLPLEEQDIKLPEAVSR